MFNPKIYVADFGNFKQGFLSMKLIQNSKFRVQGMFFLTIVLRKIKTRLNYFGFNLSRKYSMLKILPRFLEQ